MSDDAVQVEIAWTIRVTPPESWSKEDVVDHVGQVMEELLHLEECEGSRISDSSIALDAGTMEVEVELIADGDTFGDAADRGFSAIRAAIHAAGGGTPNWPDTKKIFSPGKGTVQPLAMAS